jgi:hypothetical protein
MRSTGKRVSAIAMSLPSTTILGALLALGLLLPATARAQSGAVGVIAGRVLNDPRYPGGSGSNRDGGIWRDDRRDDRRDDGRYENRRVDNRRDAQRLRKEQRAREQFCRKNPRERVCREGRGYGYGLENRRDNNAAWCWDRNRDGRCDANSAGRRAPGRGVAWGRR